MQNAALDESARRNRQVFDQVLESYVRQKLAYVLRQLDQGAREAWFDASGCVWCVFDDPEFERKGDEPSRLRDAQGDAFDLQVFWSMGDVVMPHTCDETWVADRLAREALRLLPQMGYRCESQQREVDGEQHQGVLVRKKGWLASHFARR